MDEQRRQIYLALIGELLSCNPKEERKILESNQSLVDENLIQGLLEVPSLLQGNVGTETIEERSVLLSIEIALDLNLPEYLQGKSPRPETFQKYLEYEDLLTDMLQAVTEGRQLAQPLQKFLYPLLLENLDKLNDTFAYVLKLWVENNLSTEVTEEDMILKAKENGSIPFFFSIRKSYRLAADVIKLCSVIRWLFAANESNIYKIYLPDIAIKGYLSLEKFFHDNNFVREEALVLANLGCAYQERLRGDSSKNLESAIFNFNKSLELANLVNSSNIILSVSKMLNDACVERSRRVQD